MKQQTGLLIAFEGIDGTGKTTLALQLKEMLEEAGLQVVIYKEPTNETEAGKKIRASYVEGRASIEQELQWFIEDREWNVTTRVNPAVKEGKIVILDRYFFSTACYQGVRMDGDWKKVIEMNRDKFPEPQLTVIFDLEPEIARDRIMNDRQKSNTFEGLEYLTKVRNIFLEIYQTDEIGNYLLVDSSKSINEIASILHTQVMNMLEKNGLLQKLIERLEGS